MADVFVRCNSHRARDRLASLMGGGRLECYWSWSHPATLPRLHNSIA